MTKIIAKYTEKRRMEAIMLENSAETEQNGIRLWNTGWDFERVAKTVADHLASHHAKGIARALEIKIIDAPTLSGGTSNRLERLEREVARLGADYNRMSLRLNALVDELGARS